MHCSGLPQSPPSPILFEARLGQMPGPWWHSSLGLLSHSLNLFTHRAGDLQQLWCLAEVSKNLTYLHMLDKVSHICLVI